MLKNFIMDFSEFINNEKKQNSYINSTTNIYIQDTLLNSKDIYIDFIDQIYEKTNKKIKFISYFAFEETIKNKENLKIFKNNIKNILQTEKANVSFTIPLTTNIMQKYLKGNYLFINISKEFQIDSNNIFFISPQNYNNTTVEKELFINFLSTLYYNNVEQINWKYFLNFIPCHCHDLTVKNQLKTETMLDVYKAFILLQIQNKMEEKNESN